MTTANRFTGADLYVSFGGQVVTGDFREFSVEQTGDTVDITAGSEADRSYLMTIKDANFGLKCFDTGTAGSAVQNALYAAHENRTAGTLICGPQGTATGKPKYSCMAFVTGVSKAHPYDDAVMLDVKLQRTGAWVDHYEALGDTW